MADHTLGCTCRRHAPGAWERPEHWSTADVLLRRFVAQHPEYIDLDKMPEGPYRDLAAKDPWISIREAHRLTGRNPFAISMAIRYGILRGRRRGIRPGSHWYIPAADVAKIPPLKTADAIEESWFRRQSVLEVRRNRRKLARAAA